MKKMYFKFFALVLFAMTATVTLQSCEEEDLFTSATSCNADDAYDDYLDALNSFSSNPTRSSCNNLKNKANAFIDAAERCGGFDASSAHSTINSIDCSDF